MTPNHQTEAEQLVGKAMPVNAAHGHCSKGTKSKTYVCWAAMVARCHNPKASGYEDYGGRGIYVCGRWRKFEEFLRDMGNVPDGKTLERKDTNGNYEPSNCRWATVFEQKRNTRRNKFLTHDGVTLCLADWAKKIGIGKSTMTERVRMGLPIEKILSPKHL